MTAPGARLRPDESSSAGRLGCGSAAAHAHRSTAYLQTWSSRLRTVEDLEHARYAVNGDASVAAEPNSLQQVFVCGARNAISHAPLIAPEDGRYFGDPASRPTEGATSWTSSSPIPIISSPISVSHKRGRDFTCHLPGAEISVRGARARRCRKSGCSSDAWSHGRSCHDAARSLRSSHSARSRPRPDMTSPS